MKVRSGHIPLEVAYIFGPAIKITRRWDEVDQNDEELVYTEVTPAFVSDADNQKTIGTGISWAQQLCVKYNPNTKKTETIGTVQKLLKENAPLSGLKVIGLEHRSEGGRAYKVLTPEGFYFDLREDVLLDTILSEGIKPGGVLGGEYRWAKVSSEMKLVRVGSTLYSALLEASERSILASIPKNKFEVGKIYESKSGERSIFLGFISTESWSLEWPNRRTSVLGSFMPNINPKLLSKKHNRHMLWFEVPYWSLKNKKNDPTIQMFKDALANPVYVYNFSLKASQSVVREVGKVEVPVDVIEFVRQKAIATYQKNIDEISLRLHAKKLLTPRQQSYELENTIVVAAATLLMRNQGAPKPEVQEPNFLRLERLIGKEVT